MMSRPDPPNEDDLAELMEALRQRLPPPTTAARHRTREQFDFGLDGIAARVLQRSREMWWESFWGRVAKFGLIVGIVASIVGIAAGTTVFLKNLGLCCEVSSLTGRGETAP